MPKLFQINIVSNMLSTGKICEDIAKVIIVNEWKSYIAYGRWAKPSVSKARRVGGQFDMYEHFVEHRLFDNEGFASRRATRKLIQWIDEVKPDIIQLHNIHDHYLNYPLLFEYLATQDTPVVWTQHDCWAFTGGCTYNDLYDCWKWRIECGNCPEKRAIFCDRSKYQFNLKKELMSRVKNLTFVPVSDWLGDLIKKSFHSNRNVITIHNGIDISRFRPMAGDEKDGKFRILGVAAVWHKRKGFDDFIKLRELLSDDYEITLVGLTQKQVEVLPNGIMGITRTSNIEEMVKLYSNADVFVNPTYSDNFPTTNIEALACGTPVITYKTGGSPEAIREIEHVEPFGILRNQVKNGMECYSCGIVIEQGNIDVLADAIRQMKEYPLSSADCRKRAEECFDKDKCFKEYLELYDSLINSSK